MARQVHCVMKNANNFDHLAADGAIYDEMTSPTALTRNVKAAEARENFVTGGASGHVRARVKRREGIDERDLLNRGLSFAEIIGGVFENTSEILFGLGAEANLPLSVGHSTSRPEIAKLPSSSR